MHPSTLKRRRTGSSEEEDDSVPPIVDLFLPEHVWKLILQNIKSSSKLLQLRKTTKLFCSLINDQLNSKRYWEKLCYDRRIIPWHATLKNTFLDYLEENDSLDEFNADQNNWKIMYLSYEKWENIIKSKGSHKVIKIINSPKNLKYTFITSVAGCIGMIFNKRIIKVALPIENRLKVINFNLPESRRGYCVQEIGFWNVEETIIVYAKLEDRSICFWKAGSSRHILYDEESLGNIFCADNDILMNVNDNITRLTKYDYDDQYGSIVQQLVDIIGQPNDIKIPERRSLPYIIYESTPFDLEISDYVRRPYICHIPISDVLLIADAKNLWMLYRTEVFNQVKWNLTQGSCKRTITSLTMFCNTVIIGFDNGSIQLIQLYDYQDKASFVRSHTMNIRIDSKNEPIDFVKVDRVNNEQDCIMIGTKSSLKYLTF
ncbi:Protein of unknown function [Cotesia congregata]|uniref:Uncharacterized protein n=1 Tax=Cotesia congregata TaxID=51543 RepID=A0A8J2H837_COTCN|nr:Protein of unknown function [Cotesia congregata]